jgi:hypothetical protein
VLAACCECRLLPFEDVAATRQGTAARLVCWWDAATCVLLLAGLLTLLLLWKACMAALDPKLRLSCSKN